MCLLRLYCVWSPAILMFSETMIVNTIGSVRWLHIVGKFYTNILIIMAKFMVCFFIFYMSFFLVELVLEEGFYKFFSVLGIDMKVLAGSGEGAKTFDELAQIVERELGFGSLKLVFRTTVAYELVSQHVRDLERTTDVVPNRPDTIRLLSENPSHEVFTANCIGYTPYYPPDDAVQLFVGGPKYANDYQTAQTKHVSSFKDLRNKFCKFCFLHIR